MSTSTYLRRTSAAWRPWHAPIKALNPNSSQQVDGDYNPWNMALPIAPTGLTTSVDVDPASRAPDFTYSNPVGHDYRQYEPAGAHATDPSQAILEPHDAATLPAARALTAETGHVQCASRSVAGNMVLGPSAHRAAVPARGRLDIACAGELCRVSGRARRLRLLCTQPDSLVRDEPLLGLPATPMATPALPR